MITKKILTILISILFVIITGEVIYLFFFKPQTPITQSSSGESVPVAEPVQSTPTPYLNAAISQSKLDALDSLQVFKEGVLQEATLTYKLAGIISKKEQITREDEDGNPQVVESLEIQGTEGHTNTFFYSEERLAALQVQERTDEGLQPISFNDLQVGDKISMTYIVDMLQELDYDETIQGVIIIKE